MRIKERRTVGFMEKNKKTSSAPIVVSKPFLTGNPVDTTTGKSALLIFGSLLVVAVLYLIVCSMMMFDSLALRIVVNGLVVFLTLAVFYSSGMSQGSVAVNNGEIMHHRRETGAQILPEELARSYHPLGSAHCLPGLPHLKAARKSVRRLRFTVRAAAGRSRAFCGSSSGFP